MNTNPNYLLKLVTLSFGILLTVVFVMTPSALSFLGQTPSGESNVLMPVPSTEAGATARLTSANQVGGFTITNASGDTLLYVQDQGNVGIGTTNPNQKLSVADTIEATVGGFRFPDSTVQTTAATGDGHSLDAADGSPTDAVFVGNDGKVGIGTPSPQRKLHVVNASGNAQLLLQWTNAPSGRQNWYLQSASDFQIGTLTDDFLSNTNLFTIKASTGNVGIGTTSPGHPLQMSSGAHVTAGGVWTDASSRNLKENIQDLPVEEAMLTLQELRPTKFNYKVDQTEEHVGFIAEDVPGLVANKDRNGLSAMDIVAVLTKVVQEQQKRIEALEARLRDDR